MKKLTFVLSILLLGFIPAVAVFANDHGGIHIHLSTGEDIEDDTCEGMAPAVCYELKPWYTREHFDAQEDIENQAERLEDDTSWPSRREEFSDQLLR